MPSYQGPGEKRYTLDTFKLLSAWDYEPLTITGGRLFLWGEERCGVDSFAAIISAFISTAGALGVAWIGLHQRMDRIINDQREALRREGELIQLEMTQAGLKLSKVTAKAVMQQKLNGDVEEAWKWVHEVEIKYADFLRRITQVV
jgi:hypothetical protein